MTALALSALEGQMRDQGRTVIADPRSGDLYGYCCECGEFVDLHEGFCRGCVSDWEEDE